MQRRVSRQSSNRPSVIWAALRVSLGGACLLIPPGLLGIWSHQPWLFPSLGPTAFLVVAVPRHPSTRFYNTVVGHVIGILAGFAAMYLLGAAVEPSIVADKILSPRRTAASCVAVFLTLFIQQLVGALHAPAAATTLLITLGGFDVDFHDAMTILVGVLLVALSALVFRRFNGTEHLH